MKKIYFVSILLVAVVVAGCGYPNNYGRNTAGNAAIGGLVGASLGAGVGAALGGGSGAAKGAAIGGALGVLTGAAATPPPNGYYASGPCWEWQQVPITEYYYDCYGCMRSWTVMRWRRVPVY